MLRESLFDIKTKSSVILGHYNINIRKLLELKIGDVITLDQNKTEPLDFYVESSRKFEVMPLERSGYLAAKVVKHLEFRRTEDEDEEDDLELDEIETESDVPE